MKTIHALVFVSLIGSMITFSTVRCLAQQSADQKGDKPAAAIIITGDEVRQLGEIKFDMIEGGGKITPQIDPWKTGNIMIIRETTEELTQKLKVEKGMAYQVKGRLQLEKLRKVDLRKSDEDLAKEFGVTIKK